MNPPNATSRRGPLLVLVLAFVALLALPVVIATVGVDETRDAAGAAGTTTEVPTTSEATTTSELATTTVPATTTTEATVPETTTTTIDLDEVYAFAAKLDQATSTTTTAPPAPVVEPEYVEPVVQYEPAPEPEPVYEAPAEVPTYAGDPFAGLSQADRDFLACVRDRESRGDYTAVNPSSGAGGAYQFLIDTWNNTAAHAGRSDLIGTSPQYASPYDQDFLAAHLLQWYGRSPWSYSC